MNTHTPKARELISELKAAFREIPTALNGYNFTTWSRTEQKLVDSLSQAFEQGREYGRNDTVGAPTAQPVGQSFAMSLSEAHKRMAVSAAVKPSQPEAPMVSINAELNEVFPNGYSALYVSTTPECASTASALVAEIKEACRAKPTAHNGYGLKLWGEIETKIAAAILERASTSPAPAAPSPDAKSFHCVGYIEQYGTEIRDMPKGKQCIPVYVRTAKDAT